VGVAPTTCLSIFTVKKQADRIYL